MKPSKNNIDVDLIRQFQKSPIVFIEKIWKLVPQEVKPEYKEVVDILIRHGKFEEIQAKHFNNFIKGKNITWQQWLILLSIERALAGLAVKKISIVSGHGIGKSAVLSWLIIWYLFCFLNAQVGATAPTSEQIHDILWKEIALWLERMPQGLKDLFELQSGYLRVKEFPETWFARARTARKETPEAIAGLHGDYVMIPVDEASGVVDEIYRAAEGSLTGENTLVILISNGTRTSGYFYDTHHSDKDNWQTLSFNSEESPIVEEGFIDRMLTKYGKDSDEYKIRVLGQFPSIEQMDDKGWIPLIADNQILQVSEGLPFIGRKKLGIDPSGEGDDTTRWVLRDNFQAAVIHTQTTSNEKTIAKDTYDIIQKYELSPYDVTVDNFGVGANVKAELLLIDHKMDINSVNWGEPASDEEVYLNKKAECNFRAREWLIRGGAVVGDDLKREILSNRYKNNLKGKKQIMDKPAQKQILGRSPDRNDAFMLTFYEGININNQRESARNNLPTQNDIYSPI